MKPFLASSILGAGLLLAATTAQAQNDVYIDYRLTGSATLSGRDTGLVLCSPEGDGRLTVQTLGAWIFSFELPSADPGEYEAELKIAAPESAAAFHDGNARTDDALRGTTAFVVQAAGRGQANLRLVRIRFTGKGLKSELGRQVDAEGTVGCALM